MDIFSGRRRAAMAQALGSAPHEASERGYSEHSIAKLEPMSKARQKAITKLMEQGRARSAGHAVFMHQAGSLSLPK